MFDQTLKNREHEALIFWALSMKGCLSCATVLASDVMVCHGAKTSSPLGYLENEPSGEANLQVS